MINFIEQDVSLEKCPALVLNADYRPLSYYPLQKSDEQKRLGVKFIYVNDQGECKIV